MNSPRRLLALSFGQAVPMIISTMSSAQHNDRQLLCHLCGETFIFTAGEQELQRVRGVIEEPKRCPACKRRPPTVPYLPRATRAH
jgi:hypothetical protein